MKKIFLILAVFCSIKSFSQETQYKEYSYSQFFKMIEEETDTIFKLRDAIITYDSETDKRFSIDRNIYEEKDSLYPYRNDIVIEKPLELYNVQFTYFSNISKRVIEGVLVDINFKKSVILQNVANLYLQYCRFEDFFDLTLSECDFRNIPYSNFKRVIIIDYSDFKSFNYNLGCQNKDEINYSNFSKNKFKSSGEDRGFLLRNVNQNGFIFAGNYLEYKRGIILTISNNENTKIKNNTFKSDYLQSFIGNQNGKIEWSENTYSSPLFIILDPFSSSDIIDLNQFKNGLGSYNALKDYTLETIKKYPMHIIPNTVNEIIKKYMDSVRVHDEKAFREEISLKSQFYTHFKSRYNTQIANDVYIDLKDFETKRLKIEHEQNPSFRSYFKWKVNQFLKVFSDYGTEPSKAIVFSLYVIILFAFIYLLFPNSWDKHGRKRIVDRYTFFLKYMDKDAGIHEVYMDEQKEDLLEFEEFKNFVNSKEKRVPKIFTTTALPLYKWAISGTKLSASILKRIDIMKGTWSELPQKKRFWKSILLVGAFTIAIVYDIFIKMLNALMLSINTFTTLGFGEIPIKGLPRYLAIIEGFIGWFMLTIFSVSLISQLLN